MSDSSEDRKRPTGKGPKGTVFIRPEICKGCAFCIEFCPTDCLRFTRQFNAKGYHYPVMAHPDACTGCGLCGLYCPDFAIVGVRFKDLERQGILPVAEDATPSETR
jgi:2-oxoglutarate ferredoxin oxidoreductase subunit delta